MSDARRSILRNVDDFEGLGNSFRIPCEPLETRNSVVKILIHLSSSQILSKIPVQAADRPTLRLPLSKLRLLSARDAAVSRDLTQETVFKKRPKPNSTWTLFKLVRINISRRPPRTLSYHTNSLR